MAGTFFFLFLVAFSLSCKKSHFPRDPQPAPPPEGALSFPSSNTLGKRLENPYSVENMRKALGKMEAQGQKKLGLSIEATHLYVRFLPKDWDAYEELRAIPDLELSPYPLDYEVPAGSENYHDPSIPRDLPTWQYAPVPVDFPFPQGIRYEVLEDLYIPESVHEKDRKGRRARSGCFRRIL